MRLEGVVSFHKCGRQGESVGETGILMMESGHFFSIGGN